jgi:hypothetical protein
MAKSFDIAQAMRHGRYITAILLVLLSFWLSVASLANPDELSETDGRVVRAHLSLDNCLNPPSLQIARELGLMQLLSRLQVLSEHDQHKHGNAPLSSESSSLRLEINEVVLTTILQCREVVAQIDAEISEAHELKAAMGNKRDQAIKTTAIANILTNGFISGVGETIQEPFETFPNSRFQLPGEIIEASGNFASVGLGGYALRQSAGVKLSGDIKPNMLAKLFKRPNDAETEYPDVIWRYLNMPLPGSKVTRRQLLIQRWEELGRIPPQNTQKGRLYMRTLAGTIPQKNSITIGMLDDREAMLRDVKAEVAQIYKELLNIMLVVRAL